MRRAVPLRLLQACWLLVTLFHNSSQTTTTNAPFTKGEIYNVTSTSGSQTYETVTGNVTDEPNTSPTEEPFSNSTTDEPYSTTQQLHNDSTTVETVTGNVTDEPNTSPTEEPFSNSTTDEPYSTTQQLHNDSTTVESVTDNVTDEPNTSPTEEPFSNSTTDEPEPTTQQLHNDSTTVETVTGNVTDEPNTSPTEEPFSNSTTNEPSSTTQQLHNDSTTVESVTGNVTDKPNTSPTEEPFSNSTTDEPYSTTQQLHNDSTTVESVTGNVTDEPNTSPTEESFSNSTTDEPYSTTQQLHNDSTTVETVTGNVTDEPNTSPTEEPVYHTTTDEPDSTTQQFHNNSTTDETLTVSLTDGVTTLDKSSTTVSTHLPVTRTTPVPDNSVSSAIPSTFGTTLVSTPSLTSSGTIRLSTHQPKTTPTKTTHSPTVAPTTKGCQAIYCENAGVFDEDFCECVCLPGYSGVFCEVAPSKNPCVVDSSLCPGKEQYCEGDSSLPNGFECKCRTSDGYVNDTKGGCTLKKAFKSKLHVTGINGNVTVYKPAYRDPNSAASQALFAVVIEVIKNSLRRNDATKNFEDVMGVRLEEGSVIVTTVTIFPENDTVDEKEIEAVLKNDSLVHGNSSLSLDKDKFEVAVSTTECQLTCFYRGTCKTSGFYPNYEYKCSCKSLFTGDSCAYFTVLLIVIIVFGGFALLLLALLLAFFVVCLFIQICGRHRQKSEGSFSGCENPNQWSESSSGETNHALEQDQCLAPELFLSYADEARLSQLTEYTNQAAHREQSVPGTSMAYQWGGKIPVRAKSIFSTETPIRLAYLDIGETRHAYSDNCPNRDSL